MTESKKKNEEVENDPLDHTPPGSASLVDRGTPSRAANESKGTNTSATKPTFADDTEDEEPPQKVVMVPYVPQNALKEARRALNSKISSGKVETSEKQEKRESASGDAPELGPREIAHLIRTMDSSSSDTANSFKAILRSLGVDEDQEREVRELMKHPELFAGDQKPANLQVLGLPPGAQKPPEFEAAPGTNFIPDTRYYPTRFAMNPQDKNYEDGDLVYSVHEDSTYTVLSATQQSREWQSANHLPPMNLIRRIGGKVSDAPKSAKKSDLIDTKDAK